MILLEQNREMYMKNNDIWTNFLKTLQPYVIRYIFERKYHPGYRYSRHSPSYPSGDLDAFIEQLSTTSAIEIIPFMEITEINALLTFIGFSIDGCIQDKRFECLYFFFDDSFLEDSQRKLLRLLFSTSVESQIQGIMLFEGLSLERQRSFVHNCITQSDYTTYSDTMYNHICDEYQKEDIIIDRFHFISPSNTPFHRHIILLIGCWQ